MLVTYHFFIFHWASSPNKYFTTCFCLHLSQCETTRSDDSSNKIELYRNTKKQTSFIGSVVKKYNLSSFMDIFKRENFKREAKILTYYTMDIVNF